MFIPTACPPNAPQAYGISAHVAAAGQVKWRLEFRHVASPVARLLLPDAEGTAGVFALFGKVGRSPRVYASRDRDALLKQLQTAAYKKMGLTLAGAPSSSLPVLHATPCFNLPSYVCTVAATARILTSSCACTVAACHFTHFCCQAVHILLLHATAHCFMSKHALWL